MVQIICYNYVETPQEMIREFDIDICCYGYNPEVGLVTGEGSPSLSDLQKKMEGVIPVKIQPSACIAKGVTASRLDRFAERFGCDTQQAKEQLIPVPEPSYECSYGRRVWPVTKHVEK